jgi:glycosidase
MRNLIKIGGLGLIALLAACSDEPAEKDPIVIFPNNAPFNNGDNNANNNPDNNRPGPNSGSGYAGGNNSTPGNNVDPIACDDANPCPGNLRCEANLCITECDDARPCDDPLVCRAGACLPECDDANPCADPLICREQRCEFECEANDDCGGGLICAGNQCVEPECLTFTDCDTPLSQSCENNLCERQACALHTFTYDPQGQQFTTLHVAGEFNGWPQTIAGGGIPMTFEPSLNLWVAKAPLDNGTWRYKFVPDERPSDWLQDNTNPNAENDGFGGMNSLITQDCSNAPGGLCGDVATFDWRDAVMYFLLVDRFYDSDGVADQVNNVTGGDAANGPSGQYEGGDLNGVQEKLPYLRDLGVTAVWLSAPYDNRDTAGAAIDPNADPHTYSGYHGYWPKPANISFADPNNPSPRPRVEDRIGSEDDLRALIDAIHNTEGADGHGIKVLFDYVMNHVDIESGLYQAHNDWFTRENGNVPLCAPNRWDDPYWGTRCAFTTYLPAFDFANAQARAWSINDALWWAQEFGLDGYRLDAIKHVPQEWLTDLRARLNEAFPDPEGGRFYLVGETFDYFNRELLKSFVNPNTKLDGQFDFPLKANLCRAVISREMPMQDFATWMNGNDTFYGPGALMTTWIGNHDIPRAIHYASGQIPDCTQGSFPGNSWTPDYRQPTDNVPYERLGLSFAVLLTNPGIPLIYYGDEIGLAGGGDPDNRRLMPWDDTALNTHQRALRAKVAALSRIRAENKVISRGRRETLSADADTWVYRLTGCDEASPDIVVAINRADTARSLDIPAGAWTDLVANRAAQGGATQVGARSFLVLRAR